MHEELCEIAPLEYVHRSAWDENMYGVEELSDEARLIVRMKGKFLIVPKKSFYNSVPETYDGRHHQMGRYGFKDHMESLMRMFNEEVKS
ncbi:hypothetical protein JCM19038_2825 [Geomicrobium sp. JCM 19038]|nr:hypothetical protein JCM19038_2825 [Geomicrobium sp. JCM 19038]